MDDGRAQRAARMRAEILATRDLPALAPTLARLLDLLHSETATPRELATVVEADQALAARVLRAANSAFYGPRGGVTTISRAVMSLGWQRIESLAIAVGVWRSILPDRGPELRLLWRHAVRCGAAARLIARRTGRVAADEAFTAGLLHDIGRALLLHRHPEHAALLLDPISDDPAREREVFDVSHEQAGAWLGEAWRLPPTAIAAIAHHHDPPEPGVASIPGIVALAENWLAHSEKMGNGVLGVSPWPTGWVALGGPADDPNEFQAAVAEVAEPLESLLGEGRS